MFFLASNVLALTSGNGEAKIPTQVKVMPYATVQDIDGVGVWLSTSAVSVIAVVPSSGTVAIFYRE